MTLINQLESTTRVSEERNKTLQQQTTDKYNRFQVVTEKKQECIQVGRVPSAAVAISGGGVSDRGGCLPNGGWGCLPRREVCLRGCQPGGCLPRWCITSPSPVNRMTDRHV